MFPQAEWTIFTPDSWAYNLWTDIFVVPVVESEVPTVTITFPVEYDWIDWWNPSNIYEAGSTILYNVWSLDILPVFHRQGSILALNGKCERPCFNYYSYQ
jgi:alpha-glucosidase (family GH31 glycosyl hydrolase)